MLIYVNSRNVVKNDLICATPTETWLDRLGASAGVLFHENMDVSYFLPKKCGTFDSWISVRTRSSDNADDRACRFLDAGWNVEDVERIVNFFGDDFLDVHLLQNVQLWNAATS